MSGKPTKSYSKTGSSGDHKKLRTTSKEPRALLASVKASVHESTTRKRLGKNVPSSKVKATVDQKEHEASSHKSLSSLPQKNILRRQKLNFLEVLSPITSIVK